MSHWTIVDWSIVLAHVSLLIELTVFPVPSEASTYQLLTKAAPEGADDDAVVAARERPTMFKVWWYLVPTALGVICFLLPLAVVFMPGLRSWLVPIDDSPSAAQTWTAVGLILAGRVVTFTSVLQVRRSRRAGDLQPRGLFAWSRNPGLVGMYLLYAGLCVSVPSVVLLVGFVLYLWNMHRRVLMEESHLARTVGAAYEEYRGRVPRYVGWR